MIDSFRLSERLEEAFKSNVFDKALLLTMRQGLLMIVDALERRLNELGEKITRTSEIRKELHKLKEEARH